MMLVVGVIAATLGLLAFAVGEPTVFVEPAPPPRWANPDHDIYDVVLADLIENPDFNFTIRGPGPKKTQVILLARTQNHVGHEILDPDFWPADHGTPRDVLVDVVERNPRRKVFSLAGYGPSNPDVVVADLTESKRKYRIVSRFLKACGYVVPHLPGYSRDGKTALFLFSLPPLGDHSGSGCYQLKKVGGRWEIDGKWLYYLL
jgi:hypothetical protein